MKRLLVFGAVVIVLVVLVVVGTGIWFFCKRPITVEAWTSRRDMAKAGMKETAVQAPSGAMTVWQGGSGPPIVLLHGAGDQAGVWARMVPRLLRSNRVLVPDLPGHWHSPPLEGPLSIATVYGGLEALMESIGGDEPAVLVGNSMGAWVALLYAHAHPERVARVVAVNGGALQESDPGVNLFPATREEAAETVRGITGPSYPEVPGFVLDDIVRHARVGPAARLAATAGEMVPYLLDGRLHEVTVPVVLVWGDCDRLLTLDYARRMLDELPDARLVRIRGCGHVPPRECPGACNQALAAALAGGDGETVTIEASP